MSETADESIRFLYLALTGLYTEDNTRSVFTSVENYEENFSENTFSVKVRLGFLNAEDGDYHFENLSKEGYFRVESFSDYTAANDYFNKNADKFNAFLFDFRVLDSGVYLKESQDVPRRVGFCRRERGSSSLNQRRNRFSGKRRHRELTLFLQVP